ncbi:unnamed protein product [Porites evermanni]|uniref:Secreted protein n=1 Tax=Porites evermanni TaxID=104178 RepID=A0ABN8LKM4_9CNID|nr:unnamed protein product [Porites evermanni]
MNRNSLQVFQTFIFSYVRLPRAFLVSCTCCGKQFNKRTKSGSFIQNPLRNFVRNEDHAFFFSLFSKHVRFDRPSCLDFSQFVVCSC